MSQNLSSAAKRFFDWRRKSDESKKDKKKKKHTERIEQLC